MIESRVTAGRISDGSSQTEANIRPKPERFLLPATLNPHYQCSGQTPKPKKQNNITRSFAYGLSNISCEDRS